MALTFQRFVPDLIPLDGSRYEWIGQITFDNSYPTGGEVIAGSDFGADKIVFVGTPGQTNILTKHVRWDRTNSKLFIAVEDSISGIEAEAANASDQSLVIIPVRVIVEDLTP